MTALLAAVGAALVVLLTGSPSIRRSPITAGGQARPSGGRRLRPVVTVLAGAGGFTLLPTPLNVVAAALLAAVVWTVSGRAEPPAERRRREQAIRELPDVVQLLGLALASGAALPSAARQVRAARPGPASEALVAAALRTELGVDWSVAHTDALPEQDPGFARLGRALTRSAHSGAPVAASVAQLGRELAAQRRTQAADRARTVGVRAAVPLGLCLLPAFLLIGIVPVVVASVEALPW